MSRKVDTGFPEKAMRRERLRRMTVTRLPRDERARQPVVTFHDARQIDRHDPAVAHHHAAVDHAEGDARRRRQHEGRDRVVQRTGESDRVEAEAHDVGRHVGRERADVVAVQHPRAAARRELERGARRERVRPEGDALQQHAPGAPRRACGRHRSRPSRRRQVRPARRRAASRAPERCRSRAACSTRGNARRRSRCGRSARSRHRPAGRSAHARRRGRSSRRPRHTAPASSRTARGCRRRHRRSPPDACAATRRKRARGAPIRASASG